MRPCPTMTARLLPALLLASAAAAQSPDLVSFAELSSSRGHRVLSVGAPGAPPVDAAGLGAVQFLPVRWTQPIESFSPRTDLPREESFDLGFRIRLPDGTRLYRVRTESETALLQVGDAGVRVLLRAPGDGQQTGIHERVAVSAFGPWIAAATNEPGSTTTSRIWLIRSDGAAPHADVSPPSGVAGLHPSSLAFAKDGLVFTTSAGHLWRVKFSSLQAQQVDLQIAGSWIDDQVAVSADGKYVLLRAGQSAQSCILARVRVHNGQVKAFGVPGPKLGVSYDDPGRRPRLTLSSNGQKAVWFERSQLDLALYSSNVNGTGLPLLLHAMALSAIGVESELAIGDQTGVVTVLVPAPGLGNVLMPLPLAALGVPFGPGGPPLGQNVLAGIYAPGIAATKRSFGHFLVEPNGDRFFLLGPEGGPKDLIQVRHGPPGGTLRLTGLQTILQSAALPGDLLLLRATRYGDDQPLAFLLHAGGTDTWSSDHLGSGHVPALAGDRHGSAAALLQQSPTLDRIWIFGGPGGPPEITAPPGSLGRDLTWRDDGILLFRVEPGALHARLPGGVIVPLTNASHVRTIL